MKYWFIIDDRTSARSAVYTDVAKYQTKTAALVEAVSVWMRMTDSEQRACDELYIGYAEGDQECDGVYPDYNTMTDITYIKHRKS